MSKKGNHGWHDLCHGFSVYYHHTIMEKLIKLKWVSKTSIYWYCIVWVKSGTKENVIREWQLESLPKKKNRTYLTQFN